MTMRILFALAWALCYAGLARAQPAASELFTTEHRVAAPGPTARVEFEHPFALLPACRAALKNRPGALAVEAAGRAQATVRFAPPGEFRAGDQVELSCALTNRRR